MTARPRPMRSLRPGGAIRLLLAAIALMLAPTALCAREYVGGPLRAVAHFDIVDSSGVTRFVPTQTTLMGDVYYANLTNATGAVITQGPAALVGSNGMTRLLADDILGVIRDSSVIEISFSVANTNTVPVRCRPRFRFWQANGTSGGPGTYLGTVGLTFPATTFPPGVTVTTGGIPAGVLPMPATTFWVGMVFDNDNGTTGATLAQLGAMGEAVFDPPTLGTSPGIPFITNSAGSFLGTNNPAGTRVSQTSGPKVSVGWKFTDNPCPTITASAGPDGTIAPSGAIKVACGANQTFTFTPNTCYGIKDVLVDGVSVGTPTSYTFNNVVAPHSIVASFTFRDTLPSDSDGDGLLDEWETLGIPLADGSGRYTLPGADPQHRDIYIELDAMEGHVPDAGALTDVVSKFANAPVCNPDHTSGVRLHLVGDGCAPCVDQANVPEAAWPPAGAPTLWPTVHDVKQHYFGTAAERALPDAALRLAAKSRGYRWAIFAKSIGAPTGIAETNGDIVVSVKPGLTGISRDKWAGTFMHELGHSLGLGHGGRINGAQDDHNFKPNYFSVMNYLWQWPAPSTFGQTQDTWLAWRHSWVLDYSRSRLNTLTETRLDEAAGLGGQSGKVVPIGPPKRHLGQQFFDQVSMSGVVNWDGNKRTMLRDAQRDIDNFGLDGNGDGDIDNLGISAQVIEPAEDWSVLQYPPNEPFTLFPTFAGAPATTPLAVAQEMSQDDLDSLMTIRFDCNDNQIEDSEEIANGTVADADANGVPDECEGLALILPAPDPTPASAGGLFVRPRGEAHEVRFALASRERITLEIHDLTGRRVAVLADGIEEAGEHVRRWTHVDASGQRVRPGVYFVTLRGPSRLLTRRAIVLQ